MPTDLQFTTTISGYTTKGLLLRSKPLTELIEQADFVGTLFLSLTNRVPTKNEKKVLNAVLVACMDHGIYPASGFVPRVVASSGADMFACLASSLLALGPQHGGAVTAAMEMLHKLATDTTTSQDAEKVCDALVAQYTQEKKRIPGFGHPKYRQTDPRAKKLFEIARLCELDIEYMNLAKQLEHSIEQKMNKKLVLNIDGALAALLLTLKLDPLAGNAVFGLARVAGSIAHIIEEKQARSGVRRIPEEAVEYSAD